MPNRQTPQNAGATATGGLFGYLAGHGRAAARGILRRPTPAGLAWTAGGAVLGYGMKKAVDKYRESRSVAPRFEQQQSSVVEYPGYERESEYLRRLKEKPFSSRFVD